MIKIKNILNKWFSKKPKQKSKLLGYENCEIKEIKDLELKSYIKIFKSSNTIN